MRTHFCSIYRKETNKNVAQEKHAADSALSRQTMFFANNPGKESRRKGTTFDFSRNGSILINGFSSDWSDLVFWTQKDNGASHRHSNYKTAAFEFSFGKDDTT